MKKFITVCASLLASLALFVSISSVNSPSFVTLYQPPIPKALEKHRK